MWGRLLFLAVGAIAGVIGKTIYDERNSSSYSTVPKAASSSDTEDSDQEAAESEAETESATEAESVAASEAKTESATEEA
jgi:hypothetical protein